MKSQKTNAFQLMVAGAVLVLVLVCGTFAWFAVGSHANLRGLLATISHSGIPNQLNSIHYSEDGENWQKYDGQSLAMEPGKVWYFKAGFTATVDSAVGMKLVNIDGSYRAPVETSTNEGEEIEITTLPPSDSVARLAEVLQYRVNPTGADSFTDLTLQEGNRTATILPAAVVDPNRKEGVQYVYYYELKMKEGATTDYSDLSLSFDLMLEFQQTVNE